jgi:hypothetical protein
LLELSRNRRAFLRRESPKNVNQLEQPLDTGSAFSPVLRHCQIDVCGCQVPINEIEQLVLRLDGRGQLFDKERDLELRASGVDRLNRYFSPLCPVKKRTNPIG